MKQCRALTGSARAATEGEPERREQGKEGFQGAGGSTAQPWALRGNGMAVAMKTRSVQHTNAGMRGQKSLQKKDCHALASALPNMALGLRMQLLQRGTQDGTTECLSPQRSARIQSTKAIRAATCVVTQVTGLKHPAQAALGHGPWLACPVSPAAAMVRRAPDQLGLPEEGI